MSINLRESRFVDIGKSWTSQKFVKLFGEHKMSNSNLINYCSADEHRKYTVLEVKRQIGNRYSLEQQEFSIELFGRSEVSSCKVMQVRRDRNVKRATWRRTSELT
jgi:hypothetical protein